LASRPIKNVRQQRITKRDARAFPNTAIIQAFAQVAPKQPAERKPQEPNRDGIADPATGGDRT
jgi:hypothetical protein